jgi:hypothetical protein
VFDGSTARGTRWPIAEKTPAEMTAESRIAAAAARQKRDQAVAGGAGASIPATSATSAPAAPEPLAPLPGHVRESVETVMQDLGWFKSIYAQIADFATYVGTKWWWIAGGVALYFLARSLWDSHRIQLWRTEDHNQGYTT